MRYHNISKDDMLNGDGLRVVLWLSGCEHKCPGCQNPITWDLNQGLIFDKKAKEEIFEQLEKEYISGITFSGGDPLHIENRKEVISLMREIKESFPNKTIWCYTGYTLTELENQDNIFTKELIKYADILVEGRYIEALKDINYPWAGSTNQNIIQLCDLREKEDEYIKE